MTEQVGSPSASHDHDKTLYQVRVPVVFDHLNVELRQQLREHEVQLKQHLARGVSVVGNFDVGKFEVWFELNRASSATGRQDAADSAIELVEDALKRIELAPTNDERGLSVVHNQVITTALVEG